MQADSQRCNFGLAWLLSCIAFATHVADEALTGFLDIYDATVLTLHGHFSWFPRLDVSFRDWLTGLLVAIAALLAAVQRVFRNRPRLCRV